MDSASQATPKTAIIAGTGGLPRKLAADLVATGQTPVYVTFDGSQAPVVTAPRDTNPLGARLEQLGVLFDDLHTQGVTRVVFAGAMARPQIDPSLLDAHALRLVASFPKGDDALLREVLTVFEEQGFTPVPAAQISPDLVLPAQSCWGAQPSAKDLADADTATHLLTTLSPLDLGQGAVVAGGHVLGIETLQGTDAMLGFVAETPKRLRRAKGVFVKRPKTGQDLRIDMPTIGPDTVTAAAYAGLAGIVIAAQEVIVLDPEAVEKAVTEAGMFLLAQ